MSIQFLKAKYNLTILEANIFIMYNSGHEIDMQFDNVLIKALHKINN
jgi:hypothetical protein